MDFDVLHPYPIGSRVDYVLIAEKKTKTNPVQKSFKSFTITDVREVDIILINIELTLKF